nr:hypothetical protein [Tanacetum cinerariifolium]
MCPTFDTKFDPSEDLSSDHIPPLPAILSFLSSADDTIDSDTLDTPPLPTHGTPFTKITSSTQRSPIIPRRRVMILAPGQPIPHGRPYCYHLNVPVHMMTARKRVGPLFVQQLAVKHSVDHSLLDYFSPDDSARDSSSDSSSQASSDFHSDASSDSSSRHSFLDHSSTDLSSTFAGPSRRRRRSSMTSVPALPPVSKVLSPVRVDLIQSPKRVMDYVYLADVEVDPRETSLRDDVVVRSTRGRVEFRVERVTHSVMPKDTSKLAQEERAIDCTYETLGILVQRFHDHIEAIPVHHIQDSALTWWKSHKRTIGVEPAYAMKWDGLMKLMNKVYCPRNEIQKMETKFWNLTMKGVAIFLHEPMTECGQRATLNMVERIFYFNVKGNIVTKPLARITFKDSVGDMDMRTYVYRWDRDPFELDFKCGFDARCQAKTPIETYYNLENFVHGAGKPLKTIRDTTHGFISTTLSGS